MPKEITQLIHNNFTRGRPGAIKLLVLHDTESHDRPGVSDLVGLRNFFNQPSTVASAHKIADAEGNRITCVEDGDKAWHVCGYNGVALGLEQVGQATFSTSEWMRHHMPLLHTAARTLAEWHLAHGVPLRRGRVARGHVLRSGVVEHMDLGQPGCGHSDCGKGYPRKFVVNWARLLVLDHKRQGHTRKAQQLRKSVLDYAHKYGKPAASLMASIQSKETTMHDSVLPYNRIVQWLAGPISAAVGIGFGWVAVRLHVVIPPGVKNQVVLGVSGGAISIVGAGLTYLAHHKWFTNLVHWIYANEPHTVHNTFVTGDPDDTTALETAGAGGTPRAPVS